VPNNPAGNNALIAINDRDTMPSASKIAILLPDNESDGETLKAKVIKGTLIKKT